MRAGMGRPDLLYVTAVSVKRNQFCMRVNNLEEKFIFGLYVNASVGGKLASTFKM